jgi:DNA-binding NarL/FixJ family response regulator
LKIKDRLPNVTVIVLSNLKRDKTAIEAMLAGAENCLVKGCINSDLLRRTIDSAIRRERVEKALVSH